MLKKNLSDFKIAKQLSFGVVFIVDSLEFLEMDVLKSSQENILNKAVH